MKGRFRGLALAGILTLYVAIVGLARQAPTGPKTFEVAAIRPSNANSPPLAMGRTASQFTTSNTSLPFLIRWAYDIDEDQLIAPKGLESAKFDIVAKIPEDTKLGPGELQIMMQSLLADR